MTIGQWIKKQRTQVWVWTQADLAARLGVNRSAVAQWENGTTTPHYLRMDGLTRALGEIPAKIAKATWG